MPSIAASDSGFDSHLCLARAKAGALPLAMVALLRTWVAAQLYRPVPCRQ